MEGSRDVTIGLGLGGGRQAPHRTSQPPQTGTVIGLFCTAVLGHRLIEGYLFVVFCVVVVDNNM